MNQITALWSFAVFLASVFAALLAGVTFEPKYSKRVRYPLWALAAVVSYAATYFAYTIDLTNDAFGILGLSAIVTVMVCLLYKGTLSSKIFVSLTACLIANVCTFMFCGTTDTLLAGRLGLIQVSPYEVPNILFFIGIKIVVYSIIFFVYFAYYRSKSY